MKFKDRFQAGRLLATQLFDYRDRADVVVLALPGGGVPVGYEVAGTLQAPLDVLVVRKIGVPGFEELAMGALAADDIETISTRTVEYFHVSPEALRKVIDEERTELRRREFRFRHGLPFPEVRDKIVLLIDDGLATGQTMGAAIAAVQRHAPKEIVVAVPVGSADTCRRLTAKVTKVVCFCKPAFFDAVGAFYADFHHVTDEEVETLLQILREELRAIPAASAKT